MSELMISGADNVVSSIGAAPVGERPHV